MHENARAGRLRPRAALIFEIYGSDAEPLPVEVTGELDTRDGQGVWRIDGTWEATIEGARRADPTIRDGNWDATPREWAEHTGSDEAAALLASRGA